MVAVAADHFAATTQSVFRESVVAEILPAENWLQHKETVLVAGIQKGRRGGVVRGADVVESSLFDLPRIAPLGIIRKGVTNVGILLMAVYAAQESGFTVQAQAFGRDDDLPYAEARLFLVDASFSDV